MNKESLIEYYRLLHRDSCKNFDDLSFHNVFFKQCITYDQYPKNQQELKDEIARLNYEVIPHENYSGQIHTKFKHISNSY